MIAGQLEIQLIADVARLKKDMDEMNRTVNGAVGHMSRAVDVLRKAFGALSIVVAVNMFSGMVQNSINAADHLNDLSKSTGLTVKQLSGLQLASKQTGSELDGTAKAINQLARRMGEDSEKFRRMGITAREPLEAFKQLSDLFVRIQDPQRRAAMMTEALGRSWESAAPMLAEGSANIQDMIDRGARLSGVTTEMAEQADAFNDNLELLKLSSAGVANRITTALLPALTSTTEWFLKLLDPATHFEIKLGQITSRIAEQTAALGDLTRAQVDANLQETWKRMEDLRAEAVSMAQAGRLADVQVLNAERTALNAYYDDLKQRLAELEGRAKPVVTVTQEVADTFEILTEEQIKAAEATQEAINKIAVERAQLAMTGREAAIFKAVWEAYNKGAGPEAIRLIAQTSGALYDQQAAAKAAGEEWDALVSELEALGKKQVADAEAAAAAVQRANEQAAEQAAEDWRQFHSDLSAMFKDTLFDSDGSFFDRIRSAFNDLWQKILSDLIASGVMKYLTGQGGFSLTGSLSGAGVSGQIVQAGISKFAPSMAKSLGLASLAGGGGAAAAAGTLTAEGYVAMMGSTMAGGGAAAGAAGAGAAAGGAGMMATIGAALPWVGVAIALYAAFAKKSTPSFNAGFLTDPSTPLGKSGKSFQVEQFESGFAPTGFYRRSSQAEAEQVIDLFRQLDSSIVGLARNAGLEASLRNLRGFNETMLAGTTGTVFGAGGEDGKPGVGLDQQMQLFAQQLIESLRGQISDSDLDHVLSAGNVDQMIAALEDVLAVQEDVTAGTVALAEAAVKQLEAEQKLHDLKAQLLHQYSSETEKLEAAKQQIRAAFGEFGVAVPNSIADLRALIATINPLTERGQAALTALEGLSGAISTVAGAAEAAADAAEVAADAEQELADKRRKVSADAMSAALSGAREYFEEIRRDQEAAIRERYREQIQAEEALHGRRMALFRSLMDYTASLRTGDLTILNPRDQLAFAQSQFRNLAGTALNTSLAMADRITAAEGLQGAADTYLRAGRGVHASSSGYKSIFNEVMNSLDAAKFLGVNKPFDASPLESAMLAELQALNTQVAALPAGIGAQLSGMMGNLINMMLAAGKSREFVANTVTGLGPGAVAGANAYLGGLGAGTVADYATSRETIQQAIANIKASASSEGEAVARMVQAAKDRGLSSSYLNTFITGSAGASVNEILARYNIPAFEKGTEYVHQTGFAYMHEGERVVTASDNRSLVGKIEQLTTTVGKLVSVELARANHESKQMAENNSLLSDAVQAIKSSPAVSNSGSKDYKAA